MVQVVVIIIIIMFIGGDGDGGCRGEEGWRGYDYFSMYVGVEVGFVSLGGVV